jgi:hypothetical protein
MMTRIQAALFYWSMERELAVDKAPWRKAAYYGEIARTRIGQKSPREAYDFARRAAHAAFDAVPSLRLTR